MLHKRLIPVLLVQNKRLVKSVKFKNFNYLGDPINAVKIFSTKTVDELIITDIEATKNNAIDKEYLTKMASECFIPLTYSGGINNLKDMEDIFKIGFEKISIDSAYYHNNKFLKDAVEEFGSSSVVATVTIRKDFFGNYRLWDYVSKSNRKTKITEEILKIQDLQPGEIVLNNASLDGTMSGYDIPIIESVSSLMNIPFTVCGGAGEINDAKNILKIKNVTGAAAGSIFVYSSKEKGIMINYPTSN